MALSDITPITWSDGVAGLTDTNFNTEIRDSYLLLLNPPALGLQRTSSQTIPNTTWTALSFDNLLYDTLVDTFPQYDSGSPTKFTCQCDGWYELQAACFMSPSTSSTLQGAFRVNGSTWYYGNFQFGEVAGRNTNINVGNLIQLSAGDYVEFVVWVNGGASENITVSGDTPIFSVIRRRGI